MAPRRQHYRLTRPPCALSRPHVRLDNIALVPASLLPYRKQWQAVANELPQGGILVCVPTPESKQRQTMLTVARTLRDKGLSVRAVAAEDFCRSSMKP